VKKSLDEQNSFTQRRKGAKGAKGAKRTLVASLCAFAPLREIVYFSHLLPRVKGAWPRWPWHGARRGTGILPVKKQMFSAREETKFSGP
jgi:hypothetical protein